MSYMQLVQVVCGERRNEHAHHGRRQTSYLPAPDEVAGSAGDAEYCMLLADAYTSAKYGLRADPSRAMALWDRSCNRGARR
jgi:hypothetical protein